MVKKTEVKIVSPQLSDRKWYLGGILLVVALLAFAGTKFWERFYDDPDLDHAEVNAIEKEANEISGRHKHWTQYALVANTTMVRPCLRCPNGVELVTVKAGEIYKYGITSQGPNRYSNEYYSKLGLFMSEEYHGSYEMCKQMEINKILAYRFLPESAKPEVKLIRPPGNANKN